MRAYQSSRQFNGAVLVAEGGKVIFKKGCELANMEWDMANEATRASKAQPPEPAAHQKHLNPRRCVCYPLRSAHVSAHRSALSTPCVTKLSASAARPRRSRATCHNTRHAPRVNAPARAEGV